MNLFAKQLARAVAAASMLFLASSANAYEVVVGLGSSAGVSATAAMIDRSQWPTVADNAWGIVYNQIPFYQLSQSQKSALLGNFSHKQAIVEIPYSDINSAPAYIASIEAFGFSTPYLLVLNEANPGSVMTRSELLGVKNSYPNKTIIMNTRSWENDGAHVQSLTDVLDGVCIEYIPTNTPYNIDKHVSPFFEWAVNNNKIIMFLMPPQPDDYMGTRWVDGVTTAVQTIYNYNKTRLPKGWMKSNKIFFMPSNYTFGASQIPYVSENSSNSVLASIKALIDMRPQLDADPGSPGSGGQQNPFSLAPILQLLLN